MVNKGMIESVHNNVKLDSPGDLVVTNQGGTIRALEGSITLRDQGFHDNFSTTIAGGDLLSQTLEVNSGKGTADINVSQLTGVVNETGFASHVQSSNDNLNLGNICLTGDPTYKNSNGTITLNGDITVGEALTIIASKHITNSTDLTIKAGNATKGFPITLIAGAEFVNGSGTDTTGLGPIPPQPAGVATSITGNVSTTGGGIYLGTNYGGAVTIDSQSTLKKGNAVGGDVLLAAFRLLGQPSGQIDMTGSTIVSGGKGTGVNGNVSFIAGGLDGLSPFGNTIKAIQTGSINTIGGTGALGNISLQCITPKSSGASVSYNANGTLSSPDSIVPGSVILNGASLLVNGNLTGDGITLRCGASSVDRLAIGSGVTIKTIGSGASVSLIGSFGSSIIAAPDSFISSPILSMSANGDCGTVTNPINSDANRIFAFCDNLNTQVFVRDTNKGLIVFDGTLHDLTATIDGTLVNATGKSIDVITLNLTSLTGNIGLSKLSPLATTADDMTFNAGGSVFVSNACPNSIQFVGVNSAGGTFDVQGQTNFYNPATINAAIVNIGTKGDFFTNFNPTITATTSATFSTTSAATVGFDNSRLPTDKVATPLLVLNALNGNVGSSGTDYDIKAGVGGIQVNTPNGGAFLNSQGIFKKGFNIAGGAVNGVFDYTGNGSTNITGDITANLITVVANTGKLAVNPNVKLNSNLFTSLRAIDVGGVLTIGKNASIHTSATGGFGSVLLQVGPTTSAVVGTPPAKGVAFAQGTGTIFWGLKGLKAKLPTNWFFANSSDIQLTNTINAKNISFGGGVLIVAGD